jgi:hypothetical protein
VKLTDRPPDLIEVALLHAGDRSQPRVVPPGYAALEFVGPDETFTYTVETSVMRSMLEYALRRLDA